MFLYVSVPSAARHTMTQNPKDNAKVVVQDLSYLSCDEVFQLCSFSSVRCLFLSASQLQFPL